MSAGTLPNNNSQLTSTRNVRCAPVWVTKHTGKSLFAAVCVEDLCSPGWSGSVVPILGHLEEAGRCSIGSRRIVNLGHVHHHGAVVVPSYGIRGAVSLSRLLMHLDGKGRASYTTSTGQPLAKTGRRGLQICSVTCVGKQKEEEKTRKVRTYQQRCRFLWWTWGYVRKPSTHL